MSYTSRPKRYPSPSVSNNPDVYSYRLVSDSVPSASDLQPSGSSAYQRPPNDAYYRSLTRPVQLGRGGTGVFVPKRPRPIRTRPGQRPLAAAAQRPRPIQQYRGQLTPQANPTGG